MNEIRDPIYGFITPNDTELKIINTSAFQRLRRIKQLAMAYLVYPGANHTRFDHSLGVFNIASLMAEKLLTEEDDGDKRRIVRLAALLHDIGHGPFSHISEDVLEKYYNYPENTEKEKIHEKIVAKIIENDKELGDLLSPEDKKNIIGLLSGEKIDISLMKEIVSGPLDADKMDYLLRDSYFCGVKYGVFDRDRILNTLTFYEDEESHDKHIAVKYDGINSLEQFILAKYYMTTQVYRHKVRTVSDSMIIRGLELGIERDNIDFLNNLYRYNDEEKYLDNYLKYCDDKVINELVFSSKDGFAKEIFTRLYQRRLFKRVYSEKLKDIEITNERFSDKIINITSKENEKIRKLLEKKISLLDLLKCDQECVIANSFTIKSVKEMPQDSEGEIIIVDRIGKKKRFEDESNVFRSIDASMKDINFEVYAPLEYVDQRDKKNKLSKLKEQITGLLKKMEAFI